jgi:hypothetical protein
MCRTLYLYAIDAYSNQIVSEDILIFYRIAGFSEDARLTFLSRS